MALDSYTALRTAIADTVLRTDLAAVIPSWIAMAEAQMRRTVSHWRQEARVTADVSGRFYALPDDWQETVRIHDPATANRIELVSHGELQDMRAASLVAGRPSKYAHIAGSLEFYPVPDGEYEIELIYRREIPALSDSNASNWVLQYYPDAYLYGALLHSAPYLTEDERLPTWTALFASAVEGINADDVRAKWSGSGLRKRSR